jgi:hypothetical protein
MAGFSIPRWTFLRRILDDCQPSVLPLTYHGGLGWSTSKAEEDGPKE